MAVEFGAGNRDGWEPSDRLDELRQLALTAGAEVRGELYQRRPRPDPALLVGTGKVGEIAALVQGTGSALVILDSDLSPGQQRNLEGALEARVVDRTQLILDIFAQRASSREGQLQVELAQLRYLLPRLAGRGTMLSRLGGGIGTRGPGETKLEVDRRRIRQRIQRLEAEIDALQRHRSLWRSGRRAAELPLVCLVGYTNAGKSTLLNALTGAQAFVEDSLFATLDPLTRVVAPADGERFLLTDTVGFIRDLPHHLVAAFRATLEEVVEADLLVHVVDVSHPRAEEQQAAVRRVLAELGALGKPLVVALNKVDRLQETGRLERLRRLEPGAVPISALRREGLPELLLAIRKALAARRVQASFRVPYSRGALLDTLHRRGRVVREEFLPGEVQVEVEIDPVWAERVRQRLGGAGKGDGREG
ncbi:MAG: GTPase HflX [Acetobacteraceae bacterium]|nr:GTPase HflX [Acetobacteraceae bacterium]